MVSADIENLIRLFSKLPGIGPRSARRCVLHLLKNKTLKMIPFIQQLEQTAAAIVECSGCGNLDTQSPCSLCVNPKRDMNVLCVVEQVADLWAMERAGGFKGLYHILGGALSSFNGIGPDELRIPYLVDRIRTLGVKEVILALNATIEGQTTTHYIANELEPCSVKITAIAHGIPLGGELDFLDPGTIMTAFSARRALDFEGEL
jgi:recombination protein RecR